MSKRICIFGDSITWFAKDSEGGWVRRLQKYVFEKNLDIEIYNLGISSDTSKGVVKRFVAEYEARITRSGDKPSVIVAIGLNDSRFFDDINNPDRRPETGLDDFVKNVENIFYLAKENTPELVFIGLTNFSEGKTTPDIWHDNEFYTMKNALRYNEVLKDFCVKKEVPFLNIFGQLNDDELDEVDGLHPNTRGHEKMFEQVKDFLIKNNVLE